MGRRRRLSAFALAIALVMGVAGVGESAQPASADTVAQLKAKQQALKDALAQAQEGLADTGEKAEKAAAELADVQARQPAAQAALVTAQGEVRTAQDRDVELAGQLAAAEAAEQVAVQELAQGQADLADAEKRVSRLVSATYRGGGVDAGLAAAVMGGEGPSELADRLALVDAAARLQQGSTAKLAQVRAEQQHRADRLEAVRVQMADLRQQAADQLVETQRVQAQAQAATDELAALEVTKEQALADIEAQKKVYQQQVDQAQAESDDIAAQLRARAKARAGKPSSGSSSGSSGGGGGGSAAPQRGLLGNPLASMTVTSSFGYRIHPVYHVRRLHAGTDLRAACGTPVYAAADGEVVRAGPGTGYGNILVIDHGTIGGRDVATAYAHLSRFAASVGKDVKKGDLVAYSGSTGVGTACHLHFEVRVDGTPTDAMAGWL
ncbi:Murein DD-endopeptidase MepM and murein hydrolase activator NlpD, contain LysM domain [Quadrisphaera granulorum]|uniref:Murein DD-endopeptidase MepM/ murein hydrolase activator NlpD n=2 Tax=Quadrisphaera granulorum TaxID=317664 RepID=A0A316AEP4_9ACTN|nr:murein DD-endopeptidase MepM/ murein hydrolase activator NlpD [Quadrisphaera granulorum]SZE94889.1 Murein DD-endopeptidase MepM and murein hydrolase activator NlpD, contain LysM domain [Quadrisphaera granulorum]